MNNPLKVGENWPALFGEQTVGLEQPYILAQMVMWLLRGASIDDIKRQASTGDTLPYEGSEHAIYGALRDTLAARTGDNGQILAELADLIDVVLTMLQDESELTRDEILTLALGQEQYNAPCPRCANSAA